jgi:hypothetical protein
MDVYREAIRDRRSAAAAHRWRIDSLESKRDVPAKRESESARNNEDARTEDG